jgi:putative pyruvate formate lyase activating enzyme
MLNDCCLCPRLCHASRTDGVLGYCQMDDGFHISSICLHHGEEPVISGPKGICNIFFSRCNMQCIYCQNHQISTLGADVHETVYTIDQVVEQLEYFLDRGCTHVGFVSPSHLVPQVKLIVSALRSNGHNPLFVYNSNGYDRVETLRELEGHIDVYLPDLKYMEASLAEAYSGAKNYPQAAAAAVKEMFRQKGSTLIIDENACAQSGLIIRHLVLPGHIENSKAVLKFIAEELSPLVYISLMSQYYPTPAVKNHQNLGRKLNADEYRQVVEEMENLGMYHGWIQEPESYENYRPDFKREHPFEE